MNEAAEGAKIATVRIELLGSDPPIWREVDVPVAITLKTLHRIVQIAMGWEDYHLWEFTIDRQRFGLRRETDWGGATIESAGRVQLAEVLRPRRTTIGYIYDFGDGWEHKLVVTRIRPGAPGFDYPRYVGGERNAPPEDCGGIPGFYDKLEALADPDHPDRAEIVEWMGGYDPEALDAKRIAARLARIGRPRKPRAGRRDAGEG